MNKQLITDKIQALWDNHLLGILEDIQVKTLTIQKGDVNIDKLKPEYIELLLANIATAMSTSGLLGTANDQNLQSVKKRIDTSASHVFNDYIQHSGLSHSIAVSEGKDENGDIVDDPLKVRITNNAEFGIAVDVVDGTTLAVKGLDGAYTISALAPDLISFPDLQAYALGGPKDVIEKFNFFEKPEVEIRNLISNLCQYYDKTPDQLKIVTHSFDTGNHHQSLINVLNEYGVNVIIPDPVIVEPPYVLGLALKTNNAPDCMIGVFGLPEIVINTLLLSTISDTYQLRFRIASNAMLKDKNATTLCDSFNFTDEESSEISKMNLSISNIYSKESLSSNLRKVCSASTALTDDPITGLKGCYESNNGIVKTESILSYSGNSYKITISHKRFNKINYSAIYNQKIDDLSMVMCVNDAKIIEIYNKIYSDIKELDLLHVFNFSDLDNLHITLYEFGIHYGGYHDNKVMKTLYSQLSQGVKQMEIDATVECFSISNDSLILNITIPSFEVDKILEYKNDNQFMNVASVPNQMHITVARFNRYVTFEQKKRIESIVENINSSDVLPIRIQSTPRIAHIIETPFTEYNE